VSKCRGLVVLFFVVFALTPVFSQQGLSAPAWLENYPGVTPDVRSSSALIETTYLADAQPMEVEQHYRELFEAHGLAFNPYWDGMGISVRGTAHECDLLIVIRSRPEGALTKVSCAAKADASSFLAPSQIPVMGGHIKTEDSAKSKDSAKDGDSAKNADPAKGEDSAKSEGLAKSEDSPKSEGSAKSEDSPNSADQAEQHRQDKHDMPAPPLEWPGWLRHIRGLQLQPQTGKDPSVLTAWYKTDASKTEIVDFYQNLLADHEYRPKAETGAGQATKGTQQAASGHVSGFNYPNGYPGAYSLIEVSTDQTVSSGPIKVSMRFSTHSYSVKSSHSVQPSNTVKPNNNVKPGKQQQIK